MIIDNSWSQDRNGKRSNDSDFAICCIKTPLFPHRVIAYGLLLQRPRRTTAIIDLQNQRKGVHMSCAGYEVELCLSLN